MSATATMPAPAPYANQFDPNRVRTGQVPVAGGGVQPEASLRVYRINYGTYTYLDPTWRRPVDPETGRTMFYDLNGAPILAATKTAKANEPGNNIIRTHYDLHAKFPQSGQEQFTLISGDPSVVGEEDIANRHLVDDNEMLRERVRKLEAELAAKPVETVSTDPGYTGMKFNELRDLCKGRGLDINGVTRKDELIALLVDADAQNEALMGQSFAK